MSSHSPEHDIYLFGRGEVETERLNRQHPFFVALSNNELIHPSILKDSIHAVADIGTGTGIWLQDVAKALSDTSPLYLHGFDVSSAQYPAGHVIPGLGKGTIQLSVHDTLHPYPSEHYGRYDLVHIRLLTAGLPKEDYATVVNNAWDLLKPGGYIQWEELDTTAFCTDQTPELPAITKMRAVVSDAMQKLGLCPFAPQRVYDEISAARFQNVSCQIYTTIGKENLRPVARKWVAAVMRALVPPSMVALGEATDEQEAKRKVEVLIAEFDKHCEHALPLVNYNVVAGQKCD
ncbi:Methyltransferase type 12 [Penicillium hispanicum]|uniref:Methyltransferase type 12 n=1 Tax=Penicillium hispanicum TaxID=1080232 RepID=UPI0025410135|nr:Methyltransferase type 12 [Penicillium hispanicum]KAJ5595212.1 Methyltransferase type 12 [Penicillium hispanicum]